MYINVCIYIQKCSKLCCNPLYIDISLMLFIQSSAAGFFFSMLERPATR